MNITPRQPFSVEDFTKGLKSTEISDTPSWYNTQKISNSIESEINIYLDQSEISKRFMKMVDASFPNNKEVIYEVLNFIENKHKWQYRDENTEYHYHPMMAAIYCAQSWWSLKEFLATLLHDILEDTNTSYNELVLKFWEEVAEIVKLVSFSVDWKVIEEEDYYTTIRNSDSALLVKSVDRLANIYSTMFTEDTEWKNWYFDRTLSQVIPLIEDKYPVIAKEIVNVIDYLKTNEISEVQESRIKDLKKVRDFKEAQNKRNENTAKIWDILSK